MDLFTRHHHALGEKEACIALRLMRKRTHQNWSRTLRKDVLTSIGHHPPPTFLMEVARCLMQLNGKRVEQKLLELSRMQILLYGYDNSQLRSLIVEECGNRESIETMERITEVFTHENVPIVELHAALKAFGKRNSEGFRQLLQNCLQPTSRPEHPGAIKKLKQIYGKDYLPGEVYEISPIVFAIDETMLDESYRQPEFSQMLMDFVIKTSILPDGVFKVLVAFNGPDWVWDKLLALDNPQESVRQSLALLMNSDRVNQLIELAGSPESEKLAIGIVRNLDLKADPELTFAILPLMSHEVLGSDVRAFLGRVSLGSQNAQLINRLIQSGKKAEEVLYARAVRNFLDANELLSVLQVFESTDASHT